MNTEDKNKEIYEYTESIYSYHPSPSCRPSCGVAGQLLDARRGQQHHMDIRRPRPRRRHRDVGQAHVGAPTLRRRRTGTFPLQPRHGVATAAHNTQRHTRKPDETDRLEPARGGESKQERNRQTGRESRPYHARRHTDRGEQCERHQNHPLHTAVDRETRTRRALYADERWPAQGLHSHRRLASDADDTGIGRRGRSLSD